MIMAVTRTMMTRCPHPVLSCLPFKSVRHVWRWRSQCELLPRYVAPFILIACRSFIVQLLQMVNLSTAAVTTMAIITQQHTLAVRMLHHCQLTLPQWYWTWRAARSIAFVIVLV